MTLTYKWVVLKVATVDVESVESEIGTTVTVRLKCITGGS